MTKYKVPSRYEQYLICKGKGYVIDRDRTDFHQCKSCRVLFQIVEENVPIPEGCPVPEDNRTLREDWGKEEPVNPKSTLSTLTSKGWKTIKPCGCLYIEGQPCSHDQPDVPQGHSEVEQIRKKYPDNLQKIWFDKNSFFEAVKDIHTLLKEIDKLRR